MSNHTISSCPLQGGPKVTTIFPISVFWCFGEKMRKKSDF